MIHIEKGLVPFWDDYMINHRFTTAELSVNKPVKTDVVLECNKPWDSNANDFFTIINDDGLYRMYYEAWSCTDDSEGINVCYAESRDGIHWETPDLGICEFKGSKDNNIIMLNIPDNFTVMKDTNPNCPPEYRYKATLFSAEPTSLKSYDDMHDVKPINSLICFVSADGIHFNWYGPICQGYAFDTLNSLHWNPHTNKYYCYIREYHYNADDPASTKKEYHVRSIRVMESEDFVNWSEPTPVRFFGGEDYPLYTNCVMAYPYDTRYYIGFPTRYVERREWTPNFERLCGKEARLERMKINPRMGLAITDCVFMSSRDNVNFYRFDEACITPGPEEPYNWVYGDAYPAIGGLIRTKSRFKGEEDELSIYVQNHHCTEATVELVRYTYRIDGFASIKSGYAKKTLRTKPFTFDGDELLLNFRTSARGSIVLRILDENNVPIVGYTTCEIFGDTSKRVIDFDKPLSELQGRTVSFDFTMQDAEIYSMRFN